ncbi:hypothetical protein PGB90_006909 [Kerria lacca]
MCTCCVIAFLASFSHFVINDFSCAIFLLFTLIFCLFHSFFFYFLVNVYIHIFIVVTYIFFATEPMIKN